MHIIENPCVPFTTPIFEGFKHDSKLHIHGDSFEGPHANFCIEFFAGADIALHIAFRFGYDHHVVVNSMVGECWHTEERHHNPIHHGEHFHLKIKNKHHHYEIQVNGHHIKFPHSVPPHCINAMGIRGDIHIHKIHFENFHHHNGGGIENGFPAAFPVPVASSPIGYGAPPIGYGAPPIGYGAPPIGYGAPPIGYGAPPIGYGAPPIGYGAPPIGYGAPPPVVVLEEGHHHHHGLMHELFHGNHHHHHHH